MPGHLYSYALNTPLPPPPRRKTRDRDIYGRCTVGNAFRFVDVNPGGPCELHPACGKGGWEAECARLGLPACLAADWPAFTLWRARQRRRAARRAQAVRRRGEAGETVEPNPTVAFGSSGSEVESISGHVL